MAYELSWVIPSRVLLIELEGTVPTDEMIRLNSESLAHVDAGQAPVHILIDATKLNNTQVNLHELSQLSKTMHHDGIGWLILINPAKMVSFATSIVSKLLQKKMKSAESIEEALTILQKVDFSIETQPAFPV